MRLPIEMHIRAKAQGGCADFQSGREKRSIEGGWLGMRPDLGADEEQAAGLRPEVPVSRSRQRNMPVASSHHVLADADLALEHETVFFLGVRFSIRSGDTCSAVSGASSRGDCSSINRVLPR
jgi:hypothetical protein